IVDQLLANLEIPAFDDVPQQAARRLGLSRRERDVLPYLVAGPSVREIASKLVISRRTASAHVGRTLQRLGVSSRAVAAVRAVRLGLV
ncbi:MAG: hypothetical protein JNM64_19815, partial [Chloroflexia bacterium]|nr:hypothetical protein [Chloroflexia bacterium]